jgi:hypothetical protein
MIGYIKQARLAILSNGASGAFGTSPASRYILNFLFMLVVFLASTIYYALVPIMIYLEFRIKLNRNLALIPTLYAFRKMNCDSIFQLIRSTTPHLLPHPCRLLHYPGRQRRRRLAAPSSVHLPSAHPRPPLASPTSRPHPRSGPAAGNHHPGGGAPPPRRPPTHHRPSPVDSSPFSSNAGDHWSSCALATPEP